MVDASDVGGGAVMLQEGEDGVDHPLCYLSWLMLVMWAVGLCCYRRAKMM